VVVVRFLRGLLIIFIETLDVYIDIYI